MYGYWTHCFYSCDPEAFESFTKTGKKLPMAQFDKNYNVTRPIDSTQHTVNQYSQLKLGSSSNHSDSNLGGSIIENIEKTSLNGGVGGPHQTRFTLSSKSDNGVEIDYSTFSPTLDDTLRGKSIDEPHKFKQNLSVPANLNNLIKDLHELWIISPRPPHSSEVGILKYY